VDKEDEEMKKFEPSMEDLNWSVEDFKQKIYQKEYLKNIKLKYK
jgi:hypothetical protein